MSPKKIKNNSALSTFSPKKAISVKGKTFTTRNLIQDFTFDNQEFHEARWMNKLFGNSKFIKAFLRLIFPSLFWGLFTALVPILFNTMIKDFYFGHIGTQLYLSVNYTAYLYGYINPLIISFLFAAFPAVGNYIGQGNRKKLQETLRWSFYIGVVCCILGLIFEEIFAFQIAEALIWQEFAPLTGANYVENVYSVILVRWFAVSGFFYLWLWMYVPTLSSMKNSRSLFVSSVVGFVYFIIAYPSYLAATAVKASVAYPTGDLFHNLEGVVNGIGGIYLGYFLIQPLYLWIYTSWPRHFKVFEARCSNIFLNIWNDVNRYFRDYQYATRKKTQKFPRLYELRSTRLEDYSDTERDVLFFATGFKVSGKLFKQMMALAWVILLDQIGYAVLNLILVVYGTNFNGAWGDWNGIIIHGKAAVKVAKDYYKLVLANVALISTYIFTVYNGFSLLPQYFVSYYLGNSDKETAYHNSTILTNWSILFGLFLAIIIIIYGAFVNRLVYYSADPHALYHYAYKGTTYILGTYSDLWSDAYYMELIYAVAVIFDTSVAMTYYILVAGGSKFILFADTFVEVVNTVALVALFYTHYNNFYVYYVVNRIHTFLKFIIGFIVIYCGGALWGIDDKKDRKGWFKQKIIEIVPELIP